MILSIATAQNCPNQYFKLNSYSFSQRFTSKLTGCSISASASSLSLPNRRNFRFLKGGQLSVVTEIDSVKGGTASTGGRFYFILPAGNEISMESPGSLFVKVQDSAGLTWLFDEKDEVSTEQNCKLKINKKISWESESTESNKEGGFYLKSCPHSVIIDSGFKKGNNAFLNKASHSKIRDSKGNQCIVSNSEIFNYVKEGKETQNIIKSTKDLHAILSKKHDCKNLDLSPMLNQSNQVTDQTQSQH